MSKLNINRTEWLELVFEGKNKEYGAYQLRQEDGRTTTKAFFSALAFLTGIAMLPVILSSFTDDSIVVRPKDPEFGPITPVTLQPKTIEPKTTEHKLAAPKKTITNAPPIVVDAHKVDPIVETPKYNDPNPPTSGNASTGTTIPNTGSNGTTPIVETPKPEIPEGPLSPAILEKSPMFPGGIEAFRKIVGNRFTSPEVGEENVITVMVYFVVERDGSLSNIVVPRNPGYGLDQEAIRVLKSIKTKWEPGIYHGQAVRTQYSLPIVVQTN